MDRDNRQIVRRILEDVWERGDCESARALIHEDIVAHDPALPEAQRGRDAYLRGLLAYREAFPDIRFAVDDLLASGEKVVVLWTATGTHRGDLLGIPPTGRAISIRGISFGRLERGQLAETWVNWDTLGLLRQLGALPAPS